jgi:Na+/melibiose symporter-like transporter
MDSKKIKNITTIIAGFVCMFVFYTTKHSSTDTKLTMGVVFTILTLILFIFTICVKKSRDAAGIMFIIFLLAAVTTIGVYLNLKNDYPTFLSVVLNIIGVIAFISLPFVSYRSAAKRGDVESMRKSKRAMIIIPTLAILLILIIIIAFSIR